MTIQRVALVYDDRPRPETTGSHCLAALRDRSAFPAVEVEHLLPDALDVVPSEAFDLYLYVDDGLTRSFSPRHGPVAWWAIDTHLAGPEYVELARTADVVFTAQRNGAEWFRSGGIDAEWLPLACNPDVHRPVETEKRYDVAFVGNVMPGDRADLLDVLKREFPNHFVGRRYGDEMAQTFSAARIVFNRSIRDDVNMRVFEAVACGSLLVTNALVENGQDDLFHDGEHLATYSDEEELVDKVRWYLSRDDLREPIAASGRREAHARHTYRHRMERVLEAARERLESPSRPSHAVSDYHSFARPEVVALVPESARRVLDVGCGAGRLGEAVKARQSAHVTGVEYDEFAAAAARERLDDVVQGDAETVEFPPASFDCVVCADVLEHLRDPDALLRRVREWLAPGGVLVTSLPNVRHNTVVRALLEGNWTYESAGLLDETHLRFFTRREIGKMLFRAGFDLREQQVVPGSGHAEWTASGRPVEARVGGLSYRGRNERDAEEFFVYQYLTTAEPAVREPDGLTSVVLVTYGQLPLTMACLDSIRRYTDEPYELIVVDNASPDGSADWLRRQSDVRLVENDENRGFPAAVNQGIELARGDQVLLLNNDTVVTTGWLRRMLDALGSDERIGLVGPVSNNVSGPQCVQAGYEHVESLDGFAWDWAEEHAGQVVDLERLVGFCLLVDRRVIDEVGVLDERFGIGNFEDDDLCRRAREAGYRAVVAVDSFVHHVGSATFRAAGVDFAGLLEENQRLYDEKWGESAPADDGPADESEPSDVTPTFRISVSESGGLVLEDDEETAEGSAAVERPVLSLCMIVRDNEQTIRPAIETIRPWVDEMIVVDTGSKDRTPEICRELGAKVFHFAWCDDFSAARNESFRHATGEWLFWMDSDDTIDEVNGRGLRDLAHGPHDDDVLGYTVRVHCPGDDTTDVTAVDHVKLVRNRSDVRFEHRIHEQLLPAIRRVDGEVRFTDLFVVHSGSDRTAEGRERKIERDLRILQADLAERPDHPFVLFNLGMTFADVDRTDEAVAHLRRTIAVSGEEESHVRKAYALLASTLSRAGRDDEAEKACLEGLGRYPDDVELRFRSAVLHQHFGRLDEARDVYAELLQRQGERRFASVDLGLTSFKARHNLAIVLEELGRTDDAEREWRTIVDEHPEYRPGWRALGEFLVKSGQLEGADSVAGRLERETEFGAEATLLRARASEQRGEVGAAIDMLQSLPPDELDPQRELGRLLFEHGPPDAAEEQLRHLAEVEPGNAAAHHNLGALLARVERYDEAARAFETSLRIRPEAEHTRQEYERVLTTRGDPSASPANVSS